MHLCRLYHVDPVWLDRLLANFSYLIDDGSCRWTSVLTLLLCLWIFFLLVFLLLLCKDEGVEELPTMSIWCFCSSTFDVSLRGHDSVEEKVRRLCL